MELENIKNSIQLLKSAFPIDVSIALSDKHKFIGYFPGEEINLGIKEGQKLHPEEPIYKAIYDGETQLMNIPEHVFGVACSGKAVPIFDAGKIIGAVGIAVKRQNEEALKGISFQMEESLTKTTTNIKDVSSSAETLAELSKNLLDQSRHAANQAKQSGDVINVIEKVAGQTKLLGLNASIIAAKADGENSRAFSVVANQVKSLAEETSSSLNSIKDTIHNVQQVIETIHQSSEEVSSIGEQQAASTQEIASYTEEIQSLSVKLREYASKL